MASRPSSDVGFALEIQQLRTATSEVLVLGQLAGYRSGDRWFDVEDIEQLCARTFVSHRQVSAAPCGSLKRPA
jgi:hypothetical protein